MSGSGGVELAANSIGNQTTDHTCVVGVRTAETALQVPVKLNMINGPETELHNHKQKVFEQDSNSTTVRKCKEDFTGPIINDGKNGSSMSKEIANSMILSTNECVDQKTELVNDKICSCDDGLNKNFNLSSSVVIDHVYDSDTKTNSSSNISKLKANMTKTAEAAASASATDKHDGMTNGCCNCHAKGAMLNTNEQGSIVSSHGSGCKLEESEMRKILNTACSTTTHRPQDNLENLICNCTDTGISEPLSDLTKMVENVCLDSESSQDTEFTSSMEKFKPEISQSSLREHSATSGDLLGGLDQSFGIIGPAGANLDDADLEELPSSLSDFVLGCPSNQYTVPPCPPNDSDINTIHIQTGPDEHPVTLVPYKSEVQMPDIMRLITKDLSEPYSIYTYRYFIHNWPQLCFLAMHQDKCVGAIVCKLDVHKKMSRRGYIAMLAVDENYRKLQIGSSLVKKAIRAMVRGECDEVVLETEITNKPALRLYENLGFLRDKRLFRYYLNGVDALRLKLWLR